MIIYKSKGEPERYKVTDKPLEYENWEKSWEHKGELPRRVSIFRNSTNVYLTEKEMKKHLYLTKELLKKVINNIEQIESKL